MCAFNNCKNSWKSRGSGVISVNYLTKKFQCFQLTHHSFEFGIQLDGDTLRLTGIGNPWNEVWKRAK